MRISDWSSDVCSSDLHDALAVEFIGAFEFTANDTGLAPDLPRLQFSVSGQARQFSAGAGAAWGAVIGLAGAEHEVAAVGLWVIGEQFDVIDQRSEEHTSELQSLMRISYAVFCLKKKK